MVLGWRRRSSTTTSHRAAAAKKNHQGPPCSNLKMDQLVIPNRFLCPISLDLMNDPVTLSSGITYDRCSIDTWLEAGNFKCPVTNLVLRNFDVIPNHALRLMIQEWSSRNQCFGIQRVPTPRFPIMAFEVSEILDGIAASARGLDRKGCVENLVKIKKWAEEGERNKRCIVDNGAASVLANAFEAFAIDDGVKRLNAGLCEEILAILSWMLPFPSLDEETQKHLGSHASLDYLVWFLKESIDFSVKQRSILALKKILSCCNDQSKLAVQAMAEIKDVENVLFDFIKGKASMTMTKASLTIMFYLVSYNEKFRSAILNMGVVSILLETILDSEQGVTERALNVLDCLCDYKQGRDQAYSNALAIAVLVKKILRVSETATECSISALWKLCKNATREEEEERVLVEALQVGAFQKLLLVLQVRCAGEYDTKDKPTELLKLLNPYRGGLECIESVDFNSIRRSF